MHTRHFQKLKLIALLLLIVLALPKVSAAQCGVQNLPYENYFVAGNSFACWNDSTTAIKPYIFGNNVAMNDASSGTIGTSVLISPPIYIDKVARLNYSWEHINNGGGTNDSLHVYIKRTTDASWTVLKNYPFPFYSPFKPSPSTKPRIIEDFEIDSTYLNDTILVRFDFYAGANAQYLFLDNFTVTPEKLDSIYTLPFQENFDGNTWRPDSSISTSNYHYKVDDHWRFVPGSHKDAGGVKWVVNNGSTKSTGTGALNDYSGNGNYLYNEASSTGLNSYVYFPFIDFSGTPFPQLSFRYHMHGAAMGSLIIEQNNNSSWVVLDSITGQQQIQQTAPWKKHTLLLDSAGITQVRLRFRSNWSANIAFQQDAAIDEVKISGISCPFPNQFNVTFLNNTTTSVDANWPDGPNSNAYILEYGNTGFSLGSGQIDTVTSNSISLNGLQPTTTYDVYIKLLCGSSDSSATKGPFTFRTECLYVAPYLATFNDTIIDACWKTHNQLDPPQIASEWRGTGTISFPAYGAQNALDHTGNNGSAIGVDGSFPYPLDSIAILSPFIDVSQLIAPKMNLWIFSNNTDYPDENNTFYIDFYDGAQWNYTVLTYAKDSSDWVELSLPLNQFNITGDVRFRLLVDKDSLNAAWYNDIVIDDFSVEEGFGSSCALPDSLFATHLGCDSITLDWKSHQTNNLTRIKYGPTGFDFLTSGTWVANVSPPYVLNNLQVGATYDIYVVDSCSEGLGITEPLTVATDSTLLTNLNYTYSIHSYTDTSVTYFFDARNSQGGNAYTWDFSNGNLLIGDTALITFYQNAGQSVILSATNACGTIDTTIVFDVENIGIQENSSSAELSIYPNPNSGEFEIDFSHQHTRLQEFVLWNNAGIAVYKKIVDVSQQNALKHAFNIKNLPPGFYLFQVITANGNSQIEKLIIE